MADCECPSTAATRASSGLAPDIDGAGYVVDRINAWFSVDSEFYFQYHHLVGHGLLAGVVIALVACALARDRKLLVFAVSVAISQARRRAAQGKLMSYRKSGRLS